MARDSRCGLSPDIRDGRGTPKRHLELARTIPSGRQRHNLSAGGPVTRTPHDSAVRRLGCCKMRTGREAQLSRRSHRNRFEETAPPRQVAAAVLQKWAQTAADNRAPW